MFNSFSKSAPRLGTFEQRTRRGLCLQHIGGGLYDVLTDFGTVRTKHVRFEEDTFPRIAGLNLPRSELNQQGETVSITQTDSDNSEYETAEETELKDDTVSSHDSDDEPIGNQLLTYIPPESSRYGESSNSYNENDPNTNLCRTSERCSLRPERRVYYTAKAMPTAITTEDEPKLSTALKSPERNYWLESIQEEFDTLEKNGTWEVCKTPPIEKKVLPSGIILKLKRNSTGNHARCKCHLVSRGNFQDDILSYLELYAPVACIELVRIIITIAVIFGWAIHQVDVKGSFLNAKLPMGEEIYLRLPTVPGLKHLSGKVVRLIKSLYGVQKAPKVWYDHSFSAVSKLGFQRAQSSDCFFTWITPCGKYICALLR